MIGVDGPAALEVAGLDAFYGRSQVVGDLGLRIGSGETVALLGRNGVGKTTVLKAIAGVVDARARILCLHGDDLTRLPAHERVRAGLVMVPSGARAFADLTVRENLTLAPPGRRRGGGWTVERVWETFPTLARLRDSRAGTLSGGERQMLAIGRAMVAHPRLLMLDEPSEGLAPLVVREIRRLLPELRHEGLSILLTEQNHRLALDVADRVYFVEKGRTVWEGPSDEARDHAVIGRYLAL